MLLLVLLLLTASCLCDITGSTAAGSNNMGDYFTTMSSTYKHTHAFTYTGSVQQWVVPANVATFTVDAYGAAGGDFVGGGSGGLGGYISVSNITASSFVGKTLFIHVGAAGAYNTAPGFGGGGGCTGKCGGINNPYTSGGGATDLRTSYSSLTSRLVVAGGGGGGGQGPQISEAGAYGGAGGGITGQAGADCSASNGEVGGGGGGQTAGGAGHTANFTGMSTSGNLGQGGNGSDSSGGGGGGYNGGGGGVGLSGGGGGSSYANPSYTITNNSQGVQSGNGTLYITYTSCSAGFRLSAFFNCVCKTSCEPTTSPTSQPTGQPSCLPSAQPTSEPSRRPSGKPTGQPSRQPSSRPSSRPTSNPTKHVETNKPTAAPSLHLSTSPSLPSKNVTTSFPSPAPTSPPMQTPSPKPSAAAAPTLLQPVSLLAVQTFIGLSYASYQDDTTGVHAANATKYIEAITFALFDAVMLSPSNAKISAMNISSTPVVAFATSSRRLAQVQSPSFDATYTISLSYVSFSSFKQAFSSAVQSTTFINKLHSYAVPGAPGLLDVTSTLFASLTDNLAPPPPPSSTSTGYVFDVPVNDTYFLAAVVVLTFLLATYVHRGRADMIAQHEDDSSKRRKVVAISFFDISLSLLLVIVSMVAQLLQASNYLSSHVSSSSSIYAYFIIALRLLVALSTIYLVHATLFQAWLSPFLEAKRLHASFMFAVIIIVSLFDPSLLRLLPWISTPFSDRAGGMPNFTFFKIVNIVTITNSIGMTIIVVVSIALQKQQGNSNVGGGDAFISLALSMSNFVISLLTVLLRVVAEKVYDITVALGRREDYQAEGEEEKRNDASNEKDEEDEDSVIEKGEAAGGEHFSLRMRTLQEQEARDTLLRRERELRTQAALDLVMATNEKSKAYASDVKHADENLMVMRNQLLKKGEMPLMYIPLDELQAELNEWIAKINRNEPYDEKRLDFLVACLEINPDAIAEQQRIRSEWDAANTAFLDTCFVELFAFIPPDIASLTLEQLVAKGYTKELAKRFAVQCKCLRLLRLPSHEIGRMHESDLTARFSVEGVNLDLRELCAIYAKIRQVVFLNDQRGTKAAYRNRLYEKIVKLRKDDLAGTLIEAKKIHPAYKNNTPLYANRESLTEMDLVSGSDPFGRQNDFRLISFSTDAKAGGGDDDDDDGGGGGGGGGSGKGFTKQRMSELENAFAARPSTSIAHSTRLSLTMTSSTTMSDHIPNPNPLASHLVQQAIIRRHQQGNEG